jgi:hypothetical protein
MLLKVGGMMDMFMGFLFGFGMAVVIVLIAADTEWMW